MDDELTSINSIYGDGTLVLINEQSRLCTLQLPACPSVVVRVEFPENYPDSPPSILGTQSIGNDAPKGAGKRLVDVMRQVLGRIFQPGDACVFDLIEDTAVVLENEPILNVDDSLDGHVETAEAASESSNALDLGPVPPWVIAPAITEKKSVFLARVANVTSPGEAKQYLGHLLATDKKAAKATHNIVAWRIHGPEGSSFQDCDDDGENAAGGRLLHLLQLMDVWDVMVIVTRWYGGVLLGPDRFRIINSAARDALQLGGYAKDSKKVKR
jgi:hypothetical protein